MNAPLKPKDFASDQEVRWCPGCGDYVILNAIQRTMVNTGATRENTVFVSGIGCSSRFPYYMSTYGFHTIHGRAPAIATGVKLSNPDLDVWVISGDGDGLSIGGNHLLHMLRRNVDLQFLLFNNEIYGLTKGQYSPTSRTGTSSPSSPFGSVDQPVVPAKFALGAGARFVARALDANPKDLPVIMQRAKEHKGTSFVEIYQNCIVYNDGVFAEFAEKDVAADRQLLVEHGKPMIFGADSNKGLRMNPETFSMEVVTIGENGITEADILVHDEKNGVIANMLSSLQGPHFPVALGVLYCNPDVSYEQAVMAQEAHARENAKVKTINDLLRTGHTWTVD